MKIFKHANLSGKSTCLLCGEAKDKPVILVGIVGTESGGNMEARQVHVDCIDLLYYPEPGIIAQKVEEK